VSNREGSSPSPDTISHDIASMKIITRAQWPHTIADIRKSLDGVWGLVGATGENGNLFRLERSLQDPVVYRLTEYKGTDEEVALSSTVYEAAQKEEAVKEFAQRLGFTESAC
jgi:hypothetical protein